MSLNDYVSFWTLVKMPSSKPKQKSIMSKDFLVGADPEFFVCDRNTGEIVSSIGKVGGTKDKPLLLGEIWDNDPRSKMFCLEDNVLVEINVPPVSDYGAHYSLFQKARTLLQNHLAKANLSFKGYASYNFPKEKLDDPRAFMFGCDPDWNAWTGEINPKPFCENVNFRSAGGHIHLGIKGLSQTQKENLVKWLDIFVGFGLAMCDPDKDRKKLYGKAGAMRYKPYGLEYRVPSNWWAGKAMSGNAYVSRALFRAIEHAVDKINDPISADDKEAVIAYLNNDDKNATSVITKKYAQPIMELMG